MASDILQFIVYGVALVLLAWPLGLYMARVFAGERTMAVMQAVCREALATFDGDVAQLWALAEEEAVLVYQEPPPWQFWQFDSSDVRAARKGPPALLRARVRADWLSPSRDDQVGVSRPRDR